MSGRESGGEGVREYKLRCPSLKGNLEAARSLIVSRRVHVSSGVRGPASS